MKTVLFLPVAFGWAWRAQLALLCILIMLISGVSRAEVNEEAVRFKVQGFRYYTGQGVTVNYAKALGLYLRAAKLGDAESQFIVGGMLYKGMGTDPDHIRAFYWLSQAAQQGKTTPESMQIMGSLYLRGNGIPQSYKNAKKWLEPAARADNLQAINDLAFIYYHGLDGDRQFKRALELYTRAAMLGDVSAQGNVGMMYASGIGVPVDLTLGYAWCSLAASRGNMTARGYQDSLMADMSWEQLNRAQALSVELYKQIAENSAQQ